VHLIGFIITTTLKEVRLGEQLSNKWKTNNISFSTNSAQVMSLLQHPLYLRQILLKWKEFANYLFTPLFIYLSLILRNMKKINSGQINEV